MRCCLPVVRCCLPVLIMIAQSLIVVSTRCVLFLMKTFVVEMLCHCNSFVLMLCECSLRFSVNHEVIHIAVLCMDCVVSDK